MNPEAEFVDELIEHVAPLLAKRVDPADVSPGQDVGIVTIPQLHGYLSALACSPQPPPTAQWLHGLWGDFPPAWPTVEDERLDRELLENVLEGISSDLASPSDSFVPILDLVESGGSERVDPEAWCAGFLRALALLPGYETPLPEEGDALIALIEAFTPLGDPLLRETVESEWTDDAGGEEMLAGIVRRIHALRSAGASPTTFRRSQPRIGRNDPCPCGSGKKYKRCCL